MRQSIVVKSFIIIAAGVAVIGGGVFVGLRHVSEVRGDAEPLELSETYTHAAPGFSFKDLLVELGKLEEKVHGR